MDMTEERLGRNTPVLIASSVETILLMGAFLAGTTAMLNDQFPLTATWMAALLSAHLSLAILSGLGAVLLFAISYLSDRKDLFYLGLLTVVFVGLAAAGGLAFYATYNYAFSYLMALSFIIAIITSTGCLIYSL
jgi:asparagine N-glycosylation enzyme membrane subunit Stt3